MSAALVSCRDLWYFTFRPINRIVCTWTALQPINRAVGGLFALPGSHVRPLLNHTYPSDGQVNRAYFGIQSMAEEVHEDAENMVHLDMDPGDTVIFHPLLIHGSGRNVSSTTRKVGSARCTEIDPPLAVSISFYLSNCTCTCLWYVSRRPFPATTPLASASMWM